ncbi:pentapeptide repeat-containing protein [Corynebacterium diphtheriae]|nr:pentapeptide repeat-containing protein [Corynebacterium diphtheriae]
MSRLSREKVGKIVKEARKECITPDLWGADLRGANLRGADLREADLWGADLRGADLRDVDLQSADLQAADLRGADLRGADLRDALLSYCFFGGLQISKTPSGQVTLIPTCDGWRMQVGCWSGTPAELKDLISQDEGWPVAYGKEVLRRRPYLEAALALCEAHMADHTQVIEDLKAKWGGDGEK